MAQQRLQQPFAGARPVRAGALSPEVAFGPRGNITGAYVQHLRDWQVPAIYGAAAAGQPEPPLGYGGEAASARVAMDAAAWRPSSFSLSAAAGMQALHEQLEQQQPVGNEAGLLGERNIDDWMAGELLNKTPAINRVSVPDLGATDYYIGSFSVKYDIEQHNYVSRAVWLLGPESEPVWWSERLDVAPAISSLDDAIIYTARWAMEQGAWNIQRVQRTRGSSPWYAVLFCDDRDVINELTAAGVPQASQCKMGFSLLAGDACDALYAKITNHGAGFTEGSMSKRSAR